MRKPTKLKIALLVLILFIAGGAGLLAELFIGWNPFVVAGFVIGLVPVIWIVNKAVENISEDGTDEIPVSVKTEEGGEIVVDVSQDTIKEVIVEKIQSDLEDYDLEDTRIGEVAEDGIREKLSDEEDEEDEEGDSS